MSTARFRVKEHTLPASYIREYPQGTANDQEEVLNLAIKQYTPIDAKYEDEGDVTIIGAHANGFPKELYEPLWDDLYDRLKAKNVRIRSVWIADVSFQGQSSVLNEDKLGNDPSWMDHPRDLFLMVNHFRQHMKRPIVGVAHSMGGNNLINLSLMHPRLFTSLVLIDPVIMQESSERGSFLPAKASTQRRDRWPSRKAARAAFERSKFYQTWDPRVLNNWVEHGLRELPTLLYPDPQANAGTLPAVSADPTTASVVPDKNLETEVTLKTTKHQEVFSFARANFPTPEYPDPNMLPNPITHPDIPSTRRPVAPFYRPEPMTTFTKLPFVRPSVFYVFGDKSDLSLPELVEGKMAVTGVGVGGSGGAKKGRVAQITFKGVGHLIPMEVTSQTADVAAEWIVPELKRFQQAEEAHRKEWNKVPKDQRSQMSEKHKEIMLGDWSRYQGGALKTKL